MWGIIFSHWVDLKLAFRFHALLIVTILSHLCLPGHLKILTHLRTFQSQDGSGYIDAPQERMVIISPFWSEVNTENPSPNTGTVYYKDDIPSQTLQAAEDIIKACYIDQDRFRATAGLVVTWDQVSNTVDPTKVCVPLLIIWTGEFHWDERNTWRKWQEEILQRDNIVTIRGDFQQGMESVS